MSNPVNSLMTADIVLRRVAYELGDAADGLAGLEAHLAGLIGSGFGDVAELEQLQALDKLGQQLRALELFLYSSAPRAWGEIDISQALPNVWLENVRTRLGGVAVAAPAVEAEVW